MTRRRFYLGALVPFLGLVAVLAAIDPEPAFAAPAQSVDRNFDARSVSLANLNATLRIGTHDGKGVLVRASGTRTQIDTLQMSVANGTLTIEQPEPTRIVRNTVHVERNVVIARDGGHSSTIIGGTPDSAKPETTPMKLQLTLPRETFLSIRGFTGNAQIGPMTAPVDLEILAGDVRFQRLGSASLTISGGAEIDVAEATGSLDMTIDGAGEISVASGTIPAITLETNGTATLAVGGRVGRADLSLNGIADIQIAHVDERPVVDANGIATIEIGNW